VPDCWSASSAAERPARADARDILIALPTVDRGFAA
jgi:hypothetical protein